MTSITTTSKKLGLLEFGTRLLETNDLDPVYVVIVNSDLRDLRLKKFLLAYWCYYDLGTSAWITEYPRYWNAMKGAAASKMYPRGRERRHFRGNNAKKSVAYLEKVGLNELFRPFDQAKEEFKELEFDVVTNYVKSWVGFGPWIAFKVADMLERCYSTKVLFSHRDIFLFDSPLEGASLAFEKYGDEEDLAYYQSVPLWALNYVLDGLGAETLAPPFFDRPLGYQEVETMLCKWKSYLGGHYRIGEDVEASRKSLLGFSKTRLAQHLLKAGEKGGLW